MNTYVQIINNKGQKNYVYATLEVENDKLYLTATQGLRKPLKRQVELSQVNDLFVDHYLGTQQIIVVDKNNNEYTIFSNGAGVLEYLQDNIIA